MTLCIAALCYDGDVSDDMDVRVVLSFDSLISTGMFSAETEIKIESLEHEWQALVSGDDLPQARETTAEVNEQLKKVGSKGITPANAPGIIIEPAVDRVRRRMDERYVQREYAMSLADFEQFGEAYLGRQEVDRARYDMRGHRVRADVIFIGYFGPAFALYRYCGDEHRVIREPHFAVVGSGSIIALANLFQRNQRFISRLDQSLYVVYESQQLGQKAPGVGKEISLFVLRPGANEDGMESVLIGDPGLGALEEAFKRFGPQRIVSTELPSRQTLNLDEFSSSSEPLAENPSGGSS